MKKRCFELFWDYMANRITKEEFYQALERMENGNTDLFD